MSLYWCFSFSAEMIFHSTKRPSYPLPPTNTEYYDNTNF